jgi:ubiquinone biosynthesis protein COQ4
MITTNNEQTINRDFWKTIKGILALVKDPENIDLVYDIEDGLSQNQATKFAVDRIKSLPGVVDLIEERYLAPAPNLDNLLQLPVDSLGYIYASYIQQSGFDPNFYRQMEIEDDIAYVLLRIRQTHDIWHIVTGFSTDVLGELGLKAFEFAQTRRPIAVVLVAGSLLKILFQAPDKLDKLTDAIATGYSLGIKAKPLFAQKWEEGWHKSLSQWRTELNISSEALTS